jgi:hypothetical protein
MNKHKILATVLGIFLAFLFFQGCNDDPVSSPEDDTPNIKGSINVDVRILEGFHLVIYSPKEEYPDEPVLVDLKLYNEQSKQKETIQTRATDAQGYLRFTDLVPGFYYIYPHLTTEISYVHPDSTRINAYSPDQSVKVGIGYNWRLANHHFQYTIDTSGLFSNPDAFFSSLSTQINIGVRDTLYCEYDYSNVPAWIDLQINARTYPPAVFNADQYILMMFRSGDFPAEAMPLTFIVPVTHQFASEEFVFELVIEENDD